jgi:hypothetical protein
VSRGEPQHGLENTLRRSEGERREGRGGGGVHLLNSDVRAAQRI